MPRPPRWLRASVRLLLLAILLVLPAAVAGQAHASPPAASPERLILAVEYNGVVQADAIPVRRAGAATWARSADLLAIGLKPPRDAAAEIDLRTIRGLTFRIDEREQRLILFDRNHRQQLSAGPPAADDDPAPSANGWGGYLNYDLSLSRARRSADAGGLIEGVVFAPAGYAYTSAIATTGAGRLGGGVRRLDSGIVFNDPARLFRITAGDFINQGTSASRPVRMLGVQLGTDFRLRPDLVTFPVPSISAQASVPSAVDLIVNGSRRSAGEVRAGQFALADIPVQTGLNTVSVAVRDALGRETVQTTSTYTSAALLRPGLSSFAAEVGAVRSGYSTELDRYGDMAASGTYRRGVTGWLTLQVHGEGTADGATVGGGASATAGALGLFELNLSASRSRGARSGTQLAFGWERRASPVSVAARYTLNSLQWSDIASQYGSPARSYQLALNVGFDLRQAGTFSLAYIALGRGRRDPVARVTLPTFTLTPSSFITGTYSVQPWRTLNLSLNAGADPRRRRSLYAALGLSMAIGHRDYAQVGVTARSEAVSGVAELSRRATGVGELGYRVGVARGGIDRFTAGAEYWSGQGFYDAQVERTNGVTAARIGARGAVVVAGGGLFASNRIDDSFAVVDAAQRDVRIYRDNRPVGRTNRRGKLLVTDLRQFERTKLSIDPLQLDDRFIAATTELWLKPAARAGVPARFGVREDTGTTLRLVGPDDRPLPAGARALLNGVDLPIGFDGMLYATSLNSQNILRVRLPDGSMCTGTFARPGRGRPAPPVLCRPPALAQN